MIQLDSNFSNVEAKTGEYVRPPAGAYILKCVKAEEAKAKTSGEPMAVLEFDIAEGPYAGAFEKYPIRFWQLTNGEATATFKGMLGAFKDSNSAAAMQGVITKDFLFDASKLVGKIVGGSLREEEYIKQATRETKTALKVAFLCPIARVKSGELKPLEPKLLETKPANQPWSKPAPAAGYQTTSKPPLHTDEDLPF